MVRALVPPVRWPGDRPGAPERTLPEVWAARWAAQPDAPVLVDGWNPSHVLDAATLDGRTAALATVLAGRGVRPGDRVLWCARATLPSVETLVAVLRAGAVLVPLSPSARGPEIDHVVADAAPVLAICDRRREDAFAAGPPVVLVEELARAAPGAAPAAGPPRRPGDDALIVYTSGTTGKPKGAVHTHGSLLAGVSSLTAAWEWGPEDRLVLCLPLFHVHGLCAGLFGTLAAGASAVVFDRFDESAIVRAVPGSTMFFGVPTMYHRVAAAGQASGLAPLRLCVSGSAPLAADLWHRLADDGVPVLERYGMTETLLTLSNPLAGERRPGSVGLPLPGVQAAVEDADEHGVGELLVRGPSLCRGYWGGDAFVPGDWFATGDLVSVAVTAMSPSAGDGPSSSSPGATTSTPPRSRPSCPATRTWWRSPSWGRPRRNGVRPWWPTSWASPTWRPCSRWPPQTSRRSSARGRSVGSTRCRATRWARSSGASCAEPAGAMERPGACGSVNPWRRSSCSPPWGPTARRRSPRTPTASRP
jgi:malonyl-CoA/methylmalonyl-CoA synthetase